MARSGLTTNYVPAYSGNYTQGRSRYGKIERITIHHSAGTNLLGKLWQTVGRRGSSNYAVKGNVVENYVNESDIAWCDGNWDSNRRTVSIETVNDTVGGDWHVADDTLATLIKLVADIAKRNNLGTLVRGKNIFGHKDVSSKPTACPGQYLYGKLDYIVSEANRINSATNAQPVVVAKPAPATPAKKPSYYGQGGITTAEVIGKVASFLRSHFPRYTPAAALGNYAGQNFTKALKEFQRQTDLKSDGCFTIGGETWNKLKQYGFKG